MSRYKKKCSGAGDQVYCFQPAPQGKLHNQLSKSLSFNRAYIIVFFTKQVVMNDIVAITT